MARCRVDSRWMLLSASVLEVERCLPAYTRRRSSSGSEVRTERRVLRLRIERSWGTVMGIAGRLVSRVRLRVGGRGALLSPETFLTKICMVSAGSGDADREIGDEERMVMWF